MEQLFAKKNILLLVGAVIFLCLGYILLAQGPVDNPLSISVAPFILVGCYCIIIPVAIMLKETKKE